ncbi:unnamed protein product [Didymodactylos carnosus]|uniref:Uncharacterized protein n=1 Tax=Didymodactylos carnosus TaxID=1234261 RepID=A0A815YRC2_9BILA|nr:unnamed protein product [Didymodactylos carnosus]CAF1574338.1 unnamed protein product [Didymodactylos carnosus]CAF4238992.1 unnamed protein product [Didymodactylos carnosus]CAF4438809.1 unnamed protein product [Didymodactylos carnosus]
MTTRQRALYRPISDLEIEVITGLYNQARLSDPQCLIQQRGDALDHVLLHGISSDPLPNPTPPLAQSTTNFESVDDNCLLSIPSFMSNFRTSSTALSSPLPSLQQTDDLTGDEPPLPFKYEDLELSSVHAQYADIIVETLKVITTLPLRTQLNGKGIDTNTLAVTVLAPLPETKFSPTTTAPSLSLERVEQSTIIRPRTNLNHSQTTRIPKKGPQKRTIEITDIDDKYEIENVSPPSKIRRLPPSIRVNSLISRIEDVLKPFESYAEQNIISFINIADEDDTNNNELN